MKLRNVVAAITLCVCILLSVLTLEQYGRQIKSLSDATAQNAPLSNPVGPTHWVAASPRTAKAVKSSILAQLMAFKADDYQTAILYQSSDLKLNFRSLNQFRQMMKLRYPEFADYKAILFGPMISTTDRKVVQVPIRLTGTDGNKVAAIYIMVLESGIYRVAGVEGGYSRAPSPAPIDPKMT